MQVNMTQQFSQCEALTNWFESHGIDPRQSAVTMSLTLGGIVRAEGDEQLLQPILNLIRSVSESGTDEPDTDCPDNVLQFPRSD